MLRIPPSMNSDGEYLSDYFVLKRKQAFIYDYGQVLLTGIISSGEPMEVVLAYYCWYPSGVYRP